MSIGSDSGEAYSETSSESTVETADAPDTLDLTDSEVAYAYGEKDSDGAKTSSVEQTTENLESDGDEALENAEEEQQTETVEEDAGEIRTDDGEITHVKCIREDLAGTDHPETGVPYETKVVEVNGQKLEVTVPRFDSKFDVELSRDQLRLSRDKHDQICNQKLKEAVEADPEWAGKTFSKEDLERIDNGDSPANFTWHHDGGQVGRMQLVDSEIHDNTRHTGGIAIWGCKSKYV